VKRGEGRGFAYVEDMDTAESDLFTRRGLDVVLCDGVGEELMDWWMEDVRV
jgi:hypothetical protein